MGFWDQIIILSVLGLLSHYFYVHLGKKKKNNAWVGRYSMIIVCVFLLYGILMYTGVLNSLLSIYNKIPWISADPFLDGKDYMWNSFRFIGFNQNITINGNMDSIAVLLFICYIPVFTFFKSISQALFGRYSYEKGILWAISPVKN